MAEITSGKVVRLLDKGVKPGVGPANEITVLSADGRVLYRKIVWGQQFQAREEFYTLISRYNIGQADVFGVNEFYNVPVESEPVEDEPEQVTIEVSHDNFADNPLTDSLFEVTYRSDARTVLGNRPVDTLDDLNEIVNSGQYIAVPVYAYVHSGVALRLGHDFFDGSLPQGHAYFDSGMSGYMLADKQAVREWFGKKRISPQLRQYVLQYMKDVLADFAAWINGECWYIGIYSDGELQDCTTIYGDPDDELDSLCKQYGIDRDDIVDERYD